jgi:hypothetical protein
MFVRVATCVWKRASWLWQYAGETCWGFDSKLPIYVTLWCRRWCLWLVLVIVKQNYDIKHDVKVQNNDEAITYTSKHVYLPCKNHAELYWTSSDSIIRHTERCRAWRCFSPAGLWYYLMCACPMRRSLFHVLCLALRLVKTPQKAHKEKQRPGIKHTI